MPLPVGTNVKVTGPTEFNGTFAVVVPFTDEEEDHPVTRILKMFGDVVMLAPVEDRPDGYGRETFFWLVEDTEVLA